MENAVLARSFVREGAEIILLGEHPEIELTMHKQGYREVPMEVELPVPEEPKPKPKPKKKKKKAVK